MLQQSTPEDFVIATGQQYSVRQFIQWTAAELGLELVFNGSGESEQASVVKVLDATRAPGIQPGQVVVRVDPRYFRPTEVETLLGDPSKAAEKLGWRPVITAQQMCAEMVEADLDGARKQALLRKHGYQIDLSRE